MRKILSKIKRREKQKEKWAGSWERGYSISGISCKQIWEAAYETNSGHSQQLQPRGCYA